MCSGIGVPSIVKPSRLVRGKFSFKTPPWMRFEAGEVGLPSCASSERVVDHRETIQPAAFCQYDASLDSKLRNEADVRRNIPILGRTRL